MSKRLLFGSSFALFLATGLFLCSPTNVRASEPVATEEIQELDIVDEDTTTPEENITLESEAEIAPNDTTEESTPSDTNDSDVDYSEVTEDITLLAADNYPTVYKGVDYSKVYNFTQYINKYPDIKAKFGNNAEAALSHFVNYGMKEGRMGNSTFDVKSYRRQYSDLRNSFGSSLPSYYNHYINYGSKEGRSPSGCSVLVNPITKYNGTDYSKVYDYNFYVKKYADVKKAFGEDDAAVIKHFVLHGMNEQRQGSGTFSEVAYRYQNPDLRKAFRLNYASYYNHYMNYGYREKRKTTGNTTNMVNPLSTYDYVDFSNIYDFNYYRNHADLKKAFKDDDIALFEHFLSNGIREGRQAKTSVSPNSAAYKDKKSMAPTLVNAPTSWLGFNFSDVYSYGYYITHNPDVVKACGYDNKKVFLHFIDSGIFEGRTAKPNMGPNTTAYATARETYRPYRNLHSRLYSAIFVGDSRTRDMNNAVNMSPFKVYGNSGSGFDHIKSVIDANPGKLALVWSGFNDWGRYQEYIDYYKSKQGNIIFLTVGAMDDALASHAWKWGNTDIGGATFNQRLSAAKLPTVDVYKYTKSNGPQTHDGVHYTPSFSQKIFSYIKSVLWM